MLDLPTPRNYAGERAGKATTKSSTSRLQAVCLGGGLVCCLRILFVFSSYSHGVLMVFSSYSARVIHSQSREHPDGSSEPMRGFDSGGLAAIQTRWDSPMNLRPPSRPSRPLREALRPAGTRTRRPPRPQRHEGRPGTA